MTDFQKLLEERKKQQEQAALLAMAEFKTYVQANFPAATASATGLHYIITEQGTGGKPSKFQNVSVHYTGMLTNGTVFDSSHKRNQPIEFPLGAGRVIKGWDEGIALLSKGAKAKLIIPYFLAYGEQGRPPVIPAKATLIFDVELVDFR
ncbi:MAG: FKBP-type peptidyl-prolyl cis-trans isomerase [Chitinophagales bacterium]|nr:FKBP-type peptidyl-prolyl cis-trans isomerase [Chitinophagales bacterium]